MVVMNVKEETRATLPHQKAAASAPFANGMKGRSDVDASRSGKFRTSEPPSVAAVDDNNENNKEINKKTHKKNHLAVHKVSGDDLKKLLGGSFVQVLDDQRFISRLASC